jgi:hypothetical protein
MISVIKKCQKILIKIILKYQINKSRKNPRIIKNNNFMKIN